MAGHKQYLVDAGHARRPAFISSPFDQGLKGLKQRCSPRKTHRFAINASVGTGTGGKKVGKVVLAYSGGLDTSVILKWLQETYDCEVVTFTADLGQVGIPSRKDHLLTGSASDRQALDPTPTCDLSRF